MSVLAENTVWSHRLSVSSGVDAVPSGYMTSLYKVNYDNLLLNDLKSVQFFSTVTHDNILCI